MEKEVSYEEIQNVEQMLINASKYVCTKLYEYINWYVKKEYGVNPRYISFHYFPINVHTSERYTRDISEETAKAMTEDPNINEFYHIYTNYIVKLTQLYNVDIKLYDPVSGRSDSVGIYRSNLSKYYKNGCDYKAIFLYELPNFENLGHIDNVIIKNYKDYLFILDFLKEYDSLIKKDKPKERIDLFIGNGINPIYRNRNLEEFDLRQIDFDNKNISGLDISHNVDVAINFDKTIRDLTDSNINGYNLKGYVFHDYNLKNCDMRNTFASVELSTCSISFESKINSGTLFDENNILLFNGKVLTNEEIETLGIKILPSNNNEEQVTTNNVEINDEKINNKKKIKNLFKKNKN